MQQKIRSVAVLKCVGATSAQVLATYVLQVLALAAAGGLLGLILAVAAAAAIPESMLKPFGVSSVGVTGSATIQGIAVGLLVSLLFALVPLMEVRRVKPLLLLRADTAMTARRRDWRSWLAGVATTAALALLAIWQAGSLRAGLFVSAGLVVMTGALYVASHVLVRISRPLATRRGRSEMRIAEARPAAATTPIPARTPTELSDVAAADEARGISAAVSIRPRMKRERHTVTARS